MTSNKGQGSRASKDDTIRGVAGFRECECFDVMGTKGKGRNDDDRRGSEGLGGEGVEKDEIIIRAGKNEVEAVEVV